MRVATEVCETWTTSCRRLDGGPGSVARLTLLVPDLERLSAAELASWLTAQASRARGGSGLGATFAALFLHAARRGQFDELDDPPIRMLEDD